MFPFSKTSKQSLVLISLLVSISLTQLEFAFEAKNSFVLLHVLRIKCVFYAKGYHHVFLEPELWNFCFVPLVRLGQETFCPATFCPRTYIVPGQYVAGTICRPMSPLFCCSNGRHFVPGDILSRFGKATFCPGRRIVPVGNKW